MQVSQINNTNFQGRFQKTPALERIMKDADRNSLGKFNDVIKRAMDVNDGLLYKIEEFPSNCQRKTYVLHKFDTVKDISSIITGVMTKINDSLGAGAKEAEVLEKFLPTLELLYPKKFKAPKEGIISEINKNLV